MANLITMYKSFMNLKRPEMYKLFKYEFSDKWYKVNSIKRIKPLILKDMGITMEKCIRSILKKDD
jgi:hypothetical protein